MKIIDINLPKINLDEYYIISESEPQIMDCYMEGETKEIIAPFCNLKCFICDKIILNEDIPITNKVSNFIKKYGYNNKFYEDIFR